MRGIALHSLTMYDALVHPEDLPWAGAALVLATKLFRIAVRRRTRRQVAAATHGDVSSEARERVHARVDCADL